MTIDLTGGLDPARELLLAERPDDPAIHDSVSFWVFDDTGSVGLPRIGVEAVGANWEHHGIQANVAYPDGTVFRLRADAPALSPLGSDGLPTVLGAGPLAFRCVEPFATWQMTFDGNMVHTSTDALISGDIDGPSVPVALDVEATMAVPPWSQGALTASSRRMMTSTSERDLMGGERYEQLFRAVGSVTVDGERRPFTGTGLRIRRCGVRRLGEFRGHAWQTALFPSGRAFGYIAYPPRADGTATFNEGFVFDGDGELVPATVTAAPWLRRITAVDDVSLTLRTVGGSTVEITAETVLSTFDIHHKDQAFSFEQLRREHAPFPALHQAVVRYTWDGEVAYGMIERSSMLSELEPFSSLG